MPRMFRRGRVDRRRCRVGRWADGFRCDSSSLAQELKSGAAAPIDAREKGGLTLVQFAGRGHGELGPVELLLQGVKDIVIDRALAA